MNNKWKNDLRNLAESNEKKAPEGLLSDIKKEMSRRGLEPAYGKKKAHIISLSTKQMFAAAAMFAIVAGVGLYYLNHLNQDDIAIAQEDSKQEFKNPISQQATKLLSKAVETVENIVGNKQMKQVGSTSNNGLLAYLDTEAGNASETNYQDNTIASEESSHANNNAGVKENSGIKQETTDSQSPKDSKLSTQKETKSSYFPEYPYQVENYPSRKNKKERITIGASLSGMPQTNSGSQGNLYVMADPDLGSNSDAYSIQPTFETRAKHHHPVKAGLSVRIPLNERWSLHTGVNYSYLNSNFDELKNGQVQTSRKQNLHYVGVPVNMTYSLWRTPRVNVYATAGGEVEKLVKGTSKVDNQSERVKENRLVFSTNAAAGIEYKATPSVSIYAEPGASYHFKNGSKIESSYTNHPLDFNLNIGLRLNIK